MKYKHSAHLSHNSIQSSKQVKWLYFAYILKIKASIKNPTKSSPMYCFYILLRKSF